MHYQQIVKEWHQEILTDGEALDLLLDTILPHMDPTLATYVQTIDGDELTDADAILLIEFRLNQL